MNDNKQVSLYDFKGHQVRVVELEGNPWFVAADVCRALDMDLDRGAFPWLRGVPAVDKRQTTYGELDPDLFSGTNGRGGIRAGTKTTLLSEAGQYKMVMRSHKPDAKDFQDWVTSEVLPRIRKDGMYVKDEEKIDLADDDRGCEPTAAPLRTLRSPAGPLLDQPSPSAPLRFDQ